MQTDRPSINPTFYEFLISLHKCTINIQSPRNESTFFLSSFSFSPHFRAPFLQLLLTSLLKLFWSYFRSTSFHCLNTFTNLSIQLRSE